MTSKNVMFYIKRLKGYLCVTSLKMHLIKVEEYEERREVSIRDEAKTERDLIT